MSRLKISSWDSLSFTLNSPTITVTAGLYFILFMYERQWRTNFSAWPELQNFEYLSSATWEKIKNYDIYCRKLTEKISVWFPILEIKIWIFWRNYFVYNFVFIRKILRPLNIHQSKWQIKAILLNTEEILDEAGVRFEKCPRNWSVRIA